MYRYLPALILGLLPGVLPAAGNVTEQRVLDEAGRGDNWFLKGGNFEGQHFSPLSDIDDSNVAGLGLAWSTDLPVPDGISATPIVVDGVIYLSGAYSQVFAVEAATGRVLWHHDPDVHKALQRWPDLSWTARVNRGVAVWHGMVLLTTADCRLVAVDAADGKPVWSKTTCDPDLDYSITDSPYVGGNLVFVGNAGSESRKKNRGYVTAYDVGTGEQQWRFYIVPSDDPRENTTPALRMAAATWSREVLARYAGGGNNWNEMTYDPETGLLFFGTSGAYPYVHEKRSPDGGDNLFLSSVVAVDAATGTYVWHYQTVPQDSWDYNATMNIVLGDVSVGGKPQKALMIAPKNGFSYVLDRRTGKLLAADKYARVNWATRINLETGRPVYDPAGEYWKRDAATVSAVWPNMWGAHSWQPMAWHPSLGLIYIPVVDIPSMVGNDGHGSDFADTLEMVTEVDGKPFSPGKLLAWDPAAHEARWTVDHDLPFNGGLLATAGKLVFQGDAGGYFTAYAADDGERLWSVNTGSAINAAPVSYRLNGRQYVLIPIGAGGGIQFAYPQLNASDAARGPTRLLAFALDNDVPMPAVDTAPRRFPPQPALTASAETVARGKALFAGNCSGCHGKNAVARYGGSVPDLRYADKDTHATWNGIVVGGARRANGMPRFELEPDEADAIRQYVLSLH